ncbi:SRPBCC family protein [Minwuia sp.]|uniref:SRPBCC family protein n=1 Tax=Minwuia sp. TaxID=2493630 RepID=UPI003A903DCF
MADTAAPDISAEGDAWRCRIVRRFDAPLSQVWRAFSDPARLADWFGPEGTSTRLDTFEFREGGAYALVMIADDGREFPLKGRFLEIAEGRRIVMTWLWLMADASGVETTVSFDFAVDGDGTELILTHERLPEADNAVSHGEGWESSLRKLAVNVVEN